MEYDFTQELQKIETVLEKALPDTPDTLWCQQQFGNLSPAVNENHIVPLLTPCTRLMHLGGKRWRPLLQILCAQAVAGTDTPPEVAFQLTPLVEFVHTASLIHDDIEDGADTRRGKPCSHITYGMDVAINAGSWLYFEAAACIKKLNISDAEKNALYDLFLTELRLLHLGQAMDIKWHRTPSLIPSQAEYVAMVRNKTGTLARLAVKTGILAGGGSQEDVVKAGIIAQDIGVGFQIIDDVTNLTTGNPGKKRGDDIVEGKKSLPVLIHLSSNPQDKEKLSVLFEQARTEGIDSPAVEKAISLISSSGAVEQAQEMGNSMVAAKCKALAELYGTRTPAGDLIFELFESMLKPKK